MSVAFVFSASLNDATSAHPKLLSVDLMRTEDGCCVDGLHLLFLLSSHLRPSFVSVVFDFNVSLNDVAPLSPMWLSVDLMKMEKSGLLMDAIFTCFFCVHFPERAQ